MEKNRGFTDQLLMVRPACFGYNEETSKNNVFQSKPTIAAKAIAASAVQEFDAFVAEIRTHGIEVEVWQDDGAVVKPDAVFPNNWISFHQNGSIITYPMYAENRRRERSEELIVKMREKYGFLHRIEMEKYEELESYLEGTGSMVLDRDYRICYACVSQRTHAELVNKWCILNEYEAVLFDALDAKGFPIYHTNVMMAVGHETVVICQDSISDPEEWRHLEEVIEKTNKKLLTISFDQMNAYAGNMLFADNVDGDPHVLMSASAWQSLSENQQNTLKQEACVIAGKISTIETIGGGSVRCMLAEVFKPSD